MSSTGTVGEIAAVVPPLFETIATRELFPRIGDYRFTLGPYEPRFRIHSLTPDQWSYSRFFRRHRTLLFIHPSHPASSLPILPVCNHLDTHINTDTPCAMKIIRNIWAYNQMVITIYGSKLDSCPPALFSLLKNVIEERDLQDMTTLIKRTVREVDVEAQVKKMLGIRLIVPRGFKIAYADTSALWLRKDEGERIENLLLIRHELPPDSALTPSIILKDVREMAGKIVLGPFRKDALTIAEIIRIDSPLYGRKELIRIDGLWKLKKAFMGGPLIILSNTEKGISGIAFLYSPGKKKMPIMRKLEAILYAALAGMGTATTSKNVIPDTKEPP